MPRLKQETGNKYGKLSVIKREENIGKLAAWLCTCECGNITIVKGKNLRNGHTKSCGCLKKKPRGEASFNFLYTIRRKEAINKGKEWNLTKDFYKVISKKNCFYCGIGPFQIFTQTRANGSYTYNGLDRIDSSKGYTEDNVRPCCGICNRAKNVLNKNDFLAWLIRIYHHMLQTEWKS